MPHDRRMAPLKRAGLGTIAPTRSRDYSLAILEDVRRRYRFVVVGYVVMPGQFHLLIVEPEGGNRVCFEADRLKIKIS